MNDKKNLLIDDLANFWRLWRKIIYAPVRRGEVSLEQYWILLHLSKYGSKNVHELADFLGTTPSSVTLITKKMEKSNFLERVRGDPDDRTVTITITAYGRKTWEDWQAKRNEMISDILLPLSKIEQDKLDQLISKILLRSCEQPHKEGK